jgi:hypothetical protein
LPDINDVQPGADSKSTPKFFIPKSYNVTVTQGDAKYTQGTFNFCILTHRDADGEPKRNPDRTDPTKNLNAGKLDQTFFQLTKTSEHDGLMAFSRDLIFEKFLCREVANSFFIDIRDIFKKAMSQGSIDRTSIVGPNSNLNDPKAGRPPSWTQRQEVNMEGNIGRTLIDDKQKVRGMLCQLKTR